MSSECVSESLCFSDFRNITKIGVLGSVTALAKSMERATVHEQNERQRFYAAQETRELLEVLHGDYSNLSRLAQLYVRIVLSEAAQTADAVATTETKRGSQLQRELKQC